MANILLFGSHELYALPNEIMVWLQEYVNQGHTFIVGDRKGADSAFHKALSSLGASNVKIYAMDSAKNNTYEFPVRSFVTTYDSQSKTVEIYDKDTEEKMIDISGVEKEMDIPGNRQWYEFRDRQMINDCHIAICAYFGESKTVDHMIQILNILNKPCYTFNMNWGLEYEDWGRSR